jgi:hypothetical protein
MSMSIVCQRFCRTGVALSPRITTPFLGSCSSDTLDKFSTRRCCEEHISRRRGNSSSAHVGAYRRFDISKTTRNGHNPRRGSFAMSTAPEEEAENHHPTRPSIHPTVESIRSARKSYDTSVSVGFVPTMGALHEGKAKK